MTIAEVIALVLLFGVAIWFASRANSNSAAALVGKDQTIAAKYTAEKAAAQSPTPEEQVAAMTPKEKLDALNQP